jgi:hypothetical protein
MSQTFSTDTVSAVLALQGVDIDAARAAGVAETLNTQAAIAAKAQALICFEAEPAGFLHASAGAAP